ncbi:N-acetylglucosamine repressor [bioreactor metagenome]|uniref:N-acetylglucosamine repressor n=1 Tax=bioreactor metagenome TaxID=1076179 RepID=A0A644Y2U0_9ZZZZ
MPNLPRGNRDLIRGINRSILLNAIKTKGAISRADLAHLTGLSPATVTAITGELINTGLVFEKETGGSSGGRPPILLALNARGGFVIGIKLMENHVVGALTDLNAAVLVKTTADMTNKQPDAVVDVLVDLVNQLITKSGIRKKQLLGVGIGLAGVVDSGQGILRQSPFFGWKNIPLKDLIQTRLHIPIFLENDVNTLTLGERWLGSGIPEDNFIVVTIGRGIGMGMVIDGQIYRGKSGGAGEFGHIVVDPTGPLCNCGKRGCLESFVSDRAILAAAKHIGLTDVNDLETLSNLALNGDEKAIEVLESAGKLFGRELANLVNIMDPRLILISGEGVVVGETFFSAMRGTFRINIMPGLAEDTEIRVATWGDDVWARGAASVVIGEIFRSPIQPDKES